jgi:hypothetical protein
MDMCTALDVEYFSKSMIPTNTHEHIRDVKRMIKGLTELELIKPIGLDSIPIEQQVWGITFKGLWFICNKCEFEFIRTLKSIELWKNEIYIRTEIDSMADADGYYELCAVKYSEAKKYIRKLREERLKHNVN